MTNALQGLMQDDFPLTLHHIRRRMRSVQPGCGGRDADRRAARCSARASARSPSASTGSRGRSARSACEPGDRVGTFAWNNQRHFELYFAIPCVGAVLHTLNIRLFAEQLTYIVNHAEDKVIFVDDSLVPLLEKLAPSFETRRALRRDGRRRRGRAAERAALRGAARGRGRRAPSTIPSSTSARPRRSATRAARPATPRACSTRTARSACTPPATLMKDCTGPLARATACWRSCRCSTPTPGACPTARRSPAPT